MPQGTFSLELFGNKIEIPIHIEIPKEIFGIKIDAKLVGTVLRDAAVTLVGLAEAIDPSEKGTKK